MQYLNKWLSLAVIFIFCTLTSITSKAQTTSFIPLQTPLSVEQAQQDFEQWFNWLHQTHPDLSHSVKDIDAFYQKVAEIKSTLKAPITAMTLWQAMAPLNSMLADGHIKVGHGSASQWRQWIAQGTALFPLEVHITNDGMYVARDLSAQSSHYQGAKIEAINGKGITSILQTLLENTHGDTLAFRQNVLQDQFNRLFYMTFGPQDSFDIDLVDDNKKHRITLNAKAALPQSLVVSSFAEAFNVTFQDNTAILRVNTFAWDDLKQYLTFMDSIFSDIKAKGISHLIIDISKNGGGNDDMWMAGILRYIADKPYRHFSTYRSKILLKYRDPGQIVGNIEQGENTRLIQPDLQLENFYTGKVSLLIGTGTYSSSIVFANTVQDYQFAQLIGAPTGGRSTQSGGIQFTKLTHSQLQMISPRFLLTRPNGVAQMTPVKPVVSLANANIPANILTLL
ncbi:S41 family peptidase [Pseudoalteromonas sp. T1lg23B]|uniref:S41 family peptidase n=1 Tax=Pseudoalteromonas sp. T1lg23B TaxID=2077097 RepID=UPI003FA37240